VAGPRTRIAPTPSGFLHAGNAWSFLITWLCARSRGGTVHLRIDDLDVERARPEYLDDIFASLAWLGLDWDGGPRDAAEFHARFSATARIYRYRFLLNEFDPFRRRYAHVYWKELDVERMQKAAQVFEGEHDFRGYTEEVGPEVLNTRRRLKSVTIEPFEDEIRFRVEGDAFLRGMMRRMAGVLFEIGRGHRPLEDASRLLTTERDRMQWPVVLPAKGLTLMEVRYDIPGYDARKQPLGDDDD